MKPIKYHIDSKNISLLRYSKSACGVSFLLNTAEGYERTPWFGTATTYRTDFFEFYFFRKVSGYMVLNGERINLQDNFLLILSPFQHQEWHIDTEKSDYTFLIFQEEFINNFVTDKYFMYRLLYCYQNELPTGFEMSADDMRPYLEILLKIKKELRAPIADSYHLIVAYLNEFLLLLNRYYAAKFNLPLHLPQNNYAFRFKDLLEKEIRSNLRVADYAIRIGISRVALNKSVVNEFGITAKELLDQRMLQEVKNDLLFSGKPLKQISDELGFSAPNHLMRFFKKRTGKTIGDYLKEIESEGLS